MQFARSVIVTIHFGTMHIYVDCRDLGSCLIDEERASATDFPSSLPSFFELNIHFFPPETMLDFRIIHVGRIVSVSGYLTLC
jgi:hypothetical protein